MTFSEAEKYFNKELQTLYEANEIKSIYAIIINHLGGIKKAELIIKHQDQIELSLEVKLLLALEDLKTGKPVQYVIGETEFFGLRLLVDESVLIPRPETEELVDWILKDLKTLPGSTKQFSVLDIGTGSGCIAVAIKKHLPLIKVVGLDISGRALKIAEKNALLNGVGVEFIQANILEVNAKLFDVKFNLIVSNPPYIAFSEKNEMHTNVLNFEPHQALFVADEDALIFYRRIIEFSKINLVLNGSLYFEINENFYQQVFELLTANSFVNIELRKDIFGKDRMVKATKSSFLGDIV